jgi:hypothetical protein
MTANSGAAAHVQSCTCEVGPAIRIGGCWICRPSDSEAKGRAESRSHCSGEFRYGAIDQAEEGRTQSHTEEWFRAPGHAITKAGKLPRGKVLIDATELRLLLDCAERARKLEGAA